MIVVGPSHVAEGVHAPIGSEGSITCIFVTLDLGKDEGMDIRIVRRNES